MLLVSACIGFTLLTAAVEPGLSEEQRQSLVQYFGFGPMQIYKLRPAIADLELADLDGDGRTDIVIWNGYQSRFELLYQTDPNQPAASQPTAELEQNEIPNRGNMRLDSVPVNYRVAALEIADVTGDKRPDIIFFGEPKEIVVLPGRAGGDFGAPDSVRAPEGTTNAGSLCVGDFNGDRRTDVALMGQDVLMIFLQREHGGLEPPIRLVHGIKSPQILLPTDLNGDGRTDLIVTADDDRYGAYVALQEPTGEIAALQPVRLPRERSLTIARSATGKDGDDIYVIELATNRLKHLRWQLPTAATVGGDWPQRWLSYPTMGKGKQRPLAIGDVDGDKLQDCVAVDPEAAQLIMFRGQPDGLERGRAFPGLVKMTDVQIADIDRDGKNEVLVVSGEEKTLGVCRYQEGRLSFPAPLGARGTPKVAAVGALKVAGTPDRLAYVTEDDDDALLVLRDLADQREVTVKLDALDDDPAGLRFADVNQDGLSDLLLFVRFGAPLTFLQGADGHFTDFNAASTRAGLLKEAQLEGFAMADVTGDGKPEVLLAQGNLARALVVKDSQWTVVDQYNAEAAGAALTGLTTLPGPEPDSPILVMYEQKDSALLVFERDDSHTYKITKTMPIGRFDLTGMVTFLSGSSGTPAVLLADPTKLAVFMPEAKAPTLVEQHAYDSDVKDAWLADSVVGDVNHDGIRDVIVVDMRKASLEVLTTVPDGGFVRATRFQIFQGKRFTDTPDRHGEPREVLVADVTGDQIDDIVLVVHDRIIIYPGQ